MSDKCERCDMYSRLMRRVLYTVDGCWVWTGGAYSNGYSRVVRPRPITNGYRSHLGHRITYVHDVGEVLDGLDLDHLCRNRRCINPDHLEPVTRAENLNRGLNRWGGREASHGARLV